MTGPLTGTSVIDLSRALAGPHATMMLGDLGAHVIKVENPMGGDDTPRWLVWSQGGDEASVRAWLDTRGGVVE